MLQPYVKYLKCHSLKVTSQRLEILRYLDEHRTHPTADEIYTALKKAHPSLSRTTVYNSLETLKNNNLIHTLTIRGTEQQYDIKHELHHHFLCTQCGALIDIEITCPNIKKIVKGGHKVDEVQGYFKGVCKECQEKNGRKT
jgi:Fur family transcriptional regulator, peroxide stress response regulator